MSSSTVLSSRVTRFAGRPWLWVGLALLGLVVPLVNQLKRSPAPPLPVLGTLPAFSLVDQDGRAFGSRELKGYVWVAGFIFTRCPTICPVITAKMADMQKRGRGIEQAFRLVSFSVDPTYDTPIVMAAYARDHKVSPRMWKLLTGSLEGIRSTVVDGLKIAMGEPSPQGESDFAALFHGTHFVLVDQKGAIRGYYDSSQADVVDTVLHDAALLINRGD